MSNLYIGLMSGTSLDGVDAALVELNKDQSTILEAHTQTFPKGLHDDILKLCTSSNNHEINQLGQLDNRIAESLSQSVKTLLDKSGKTASEIIAIGSHGQTIRHEPEAEHPFTLQIGNPALVSLRTQIDTISDFRRADMAAGGQGAPLVPAFHKAVFTTPHHSRVILNIGGIANITVLPKDGTQSVIGFDTGPGNILLNAWINAHQGKPFDNKGAWAASMEPEQKLLDALLKEAFFNRSPPKSTGRELFNFEWLEKILIHHGRNLAPAQIQSTLSELTAISITRAIKNYGQNCKEVLVCGGGLHNIDLIDRIKTNLPNCVVLSTGEFGFNPDYVEAATFAWLAKQTLERIPANLPSVTGASQAMILGAIYPNGPSA